MSKSVKFADSIFEPYRDTRVAVVIKNEERLSPDVCEHHPKHWGILMYFASLHITLRT